MSELFNEGLMLMAMGMGTVFVFLTVLVIATAFMSRVAQALPAEPESEFSIPSNNDDQSEVVAVAAAAFATHYRNQGKSN